MRFGMSVRISISDRDQVRDVVNEKDLSQLNRRELLEMLLQQSRNMDELRIQLEEAEKKIKEREIAVANAGSIAKAALELNGVFEHAQNAADQYLENIRRLNENADAVYAEKREETEQYCRNLSEKAEKILSDAKRSRTEAEEACAALAKQNDLRCAEKAEKTEDLCRRALSETETSCLKKKQETEENSVVRYVRL